MKRQAEHKQLRDVVIEQIRSMITSGSLQAGEWLRQDQLRAELGTSYTPIREALKQLEVEGLVEHVPYRGVRVAHFKVDDVLDIYTMRSLLEGLAAGGAAAKLTDSQLAELRLYHEQMAALSGSDSLETVRELNYKFHHLIFESSERPYVIRMLRMIWSWFPTMLSNGFAPVTTEDIVVREQSDNVEHAQILAALEARDADAAEQLMRAHIEQSRRALVARLEREKASVKTSE